MARNDQKLHRTFGWMFKVLLACVLGTATLAQVGCGTSYGPYTVEVALAGDLVDGGKVRRNVEVDVLAVPATQESWPGVTVDNYFVREGKERLNSNAYTMRFESGSPTTSQQLSASAQPWKNWDKRPSLVILASLEAPASGATVDPRRLVLPLGSDRWDGKVIKVNVTSTGLTPVNGPKPPKN